jgi:hypothetical protein
MFEEYKDLFKELAVLLITLYAFKRMGWGK